MQNAIEKTCRTISSLSLIIMVALCFGDAIGRQLNHPIFGASELISFFLCICFFASLPLVAKEGSHIRVGLLTETYGKTASQIEIYGRGLLEVGCVILFAYMMLDQAWRDFKYGTLSGLLEVPYYYIMFAAGIMSACAILFAIEHYRSTISKSGDTGQHSSSVH